MILHRNQLQRLGRRKRLYYSRYLYSASKYESLKKNGDSNMNYNINEDELLERLLPRVESRISSRIVQRIIDALREELYQPEDMIREEFVKEIEEAEKEKGITLKNIHELESYLKGLAVQMYEYEVKDRPKSSGNLRKKTVLIMISL